MNMLYEYALWNVSNHTTNAFWLVGKIVYNRLQEKKDETRYEEQLTIAQQRIQDEE